MTLLQQFARERSCRLDTRCIATRIRGEARRLNWQRPTLEICTMTLNQQCLAQCTRCRSMLTVVVTVHLGCAAVRGLQEERQSNGDSPFTRVLDG